MTSGKFDLLPVSSIIINRDDRQRRDLEKVEELAESIRANGLINPIVITKDLELVAGERRLEAHKLLDFDTIAVHYAEDLDPLQLHLIELEENVQRVDLSWQDHVNAVARYHDIRASQTESWSQEQTAESLNMSRQNVQKHLMVKKLMDDGVEEVIQAPKLTTAFNFAQRMQERKKNSVLRELRSEPLSPSPSVAESEEQVENAPAELKRYAEIIQADFKSWAQEVRDQPYNFVHCDFPYGVNAGDTKGQSGARNFGGYDDKPEIYFELLDLLTKYQDYFIAPSAHMIFWFSMDFYIETKEKLRAHGWRVNDFPLIWFKTDNSGILPDSNRGPRRIYETAFFCTRGDRKVVKAVGNAVGSGVTKKFHMSEKPTLVLEHFFRMVVDDTTVMLDPTCGSGNAVKVAEYLGANWATGLEVNKEYVEGAKENLDL